jgi:thymidylate synthase
VTRVYRTGREAVYDVCQRVLMQGVPCAPRGSKTLEIVGESFAIEEPWDSLPTDIGRKGLNPAIGVLEALQNVSGVSALPVFRRMVPAASKWDDDTPTYGERLGSQLDAVVRRLRIDPESRQAVALIWREDDIDGGQASNLCTIGLQFLLRDGQLHAFAHMRSNDAWWGLCYDLFQFCQVQCSLANSLGVAPGRYHHSANSMHLYERHWVQAAALSEPVRGYYDQPVLGVGRKDDSWATVRARALTIIRGIEPAGATTSERWMHEVLSPYTKEQA